MGGDRLVERSDVRTDVRNERVVEDFRSEDTENHVVQNHEKKALKLFKKKSEKQGSAVEKILLIILCFLIPFVAVGIVTDWSVVPVVINILLCILFFLPGIIHALWHVLKS
ncbi:MAG: YqaE/Pmp3 family membrane protein [Bacteroidetes bacterium]|nr:MAG: YqaE/Pmp3 family membrane protein [Bacteroidota bacterium]